MYRADVPCLLSTTDCKPERSCTMGFVSRRSRQETRNLDFA